MGVGESLKELYYSGEEKWYNFLDKVDEHLPIYKVIDPVDEVFPSFALFLILIFIIILALVLTAAGFAGGQGATLSLSVVDEEGTSVSGAIITIAGSDATYYSNEFGVVPDIPVTLGTTVGVTAKKNTIQADIPIFIESSVTTQEIKLAGLNLSFQESKVIQLVTETGTRASGEITLAYECSTSGVTPPETQTVYDGTANVEAPADCGTLTVTVTSEKYANKTAVLDKASNTITLIYSEQRESSQVVVTLRDIDTNTLVSGVTVYAYAIDNFLGEQETALSTNGQAVFTIPEGQYRFDVKMEQGYKPASSAVTTTSHLATAQVTINLQKNFVGLINVTTKEGSTKLSGVRVTLMKGTSEVRALTTDTNGFVSFELTENTKFRVLASKDNYCIASTDANVPADVTLTMVRNTGQCGGTLKAQVLDTDGKPVPFARVIIFGEKEEDAYKLGYIEKLTDYNGTVSWNPVSYSATGETYKVFAYKGTYSGWSVASEFTPQNESNVFTVSLQIPLGKIVVNVKDNDGLPLQFSEVQLFGDYDSAKLTGKKIVENTDGTIEFNIKAGRRVYAVVKKDGYESYTTLPKQIIGDGVVTYNVVLSRPPVDQLKVNFLGLYKDDSLALRVEPGKEYTALFEVIAPVAYDELGFFVRVGKSNVTKTELDNLYIKELIAPGVNTLLSGASYNPNKGYSIDSEYLNLEQSKWAQAKWDTYGYVPGKILVGTTVKIKDTAQSGEQLVIAYRAWGVDGGSYERDLVDNELGTSQNTSTKQELYAATKEGYAWVGSESLCDASTANVNNTFCVTASYTDPDGFTNSFDTGFDAKNNTPYNVSVKVLSTSAVTFDNAQIKIENAESNLYLGNYTIISPTNTITNGTINGYESGWISAPDFSPSSSISVNSLQVTPNKIGAGTLKFRIRDASNLVFEKSFTINIASDKKMNVQYLYNNEFQSDMPQIVSGKAENVTVKVFNTADNLEISGAVVKLYDRFGTLLTQATTNNIGIATIVIPASLPAEKLTLKIEKSEYETFVKDFTISEDIVTVTPASLSFTINPQTTTSDSKTVKIENKTGFDLTIKDIALVGKFKGLISESQTESWFNNFKGTVIPANDYIETEFKVFVGKVIPQADDLTGTFDITVGNNYNEWVKSIDAKIRVGLGQDVDDPNCLEITKTSWTASTQGKEVEVAFDVVNNCLAKGQLVSLQNLGARNENAGNNLGVMSVQTNPGYAELSRGYNRIFKTTIAPGERVPITLKFVPYGGVNGTATGQVIFEAENLTDSKNQVISATLDYSISVVNLADCLVVGADLVKIAPESTGSFSVTNNCPVKADMEVDSELQVSDKIFSLNANESKDITINRSEGDLAGAYNILVKGRQGNDKQQLIGNVKAILDADGCIALSRYEYDVYDSPTNETDGVDRGYLRNNCTQKNIGVQVSGKDPYDKSRVWQQAILGALIGYFKSDCSGLAAVTGSLFGTLDCKTGKWVKDESQPAGVANAQAFTDLRKATKNTATSLGSQIALDTKELESGVKIATDQLDASYQKTFDAITTTCGPNTAAAGPVITKLDTLYKTKKDKLTNAQKKLTTSQEATMKQIKVAVDSTAKSSKAKEDELAAAINKAQLATKDLEPKVQEQADAASLELAQALDSQKQSYLTAVDEYNKIITNADEYTITDAESAALIKEAQTAAACTAPVPAAPAPVAPVVEPEIIEATIMEDTTAAAEVVPPVTIAPAAKSGELTPGTQVSIPVNKINESDKSDLYVYTIQEGDSPESIAKQFGVEPYQITNTTTGVSIVPLKDLSNSPVPTTANETTSWLSAQGVSVTSDAAYSGHRVLKTSNNTYYVFNDAQGSALLKTFPNSTSKEVVAYIDSLAKTPVTGQFILATTQTATAPRMDPFSQITNLFTNNIPGITGGSFSNSAVGGGIIAALIEMMTAQDTPINYSDTFAVPKVKITDVSLESTEGIGISVGEVTYDFDNSNAGFDSTAETASGSQIQPPGTSGLGTGNALGYQGLSSQNQFNTGILFNPQALTATQGLTEIRELTFTNPGNAVNTTPYEPFAGVLTVNASENVYQTDYNYEGIKKAAEKRGTFEEQKPIFDIPIIGDLFKPQSNQIAPIDENDLLVKSVRDYTKKFHLLFNSYEYFDCGPNTYPCPSAAIGNCTVGTKTGSTGPDAAPRVKLAWDWSSINADTCDEDNPNYVYCDTTQLTISSLKQLQTMKDFFNTHSLSKCPQAIDIAGTKSQKLTDNALDIGITMITMKPTADGATIDVIVQTNNNQQLSGKVNFTIKRADGTGDFAPAACKNMTKTFTSQETYSCTVKSADIDNGNGGSFDVTATVQPTLCSGCQNTDTSNDTITAQLVLGSGTVQNCQEYSTNYDYFQKVLTANLGTLDAQASTVLHSTNYTVNLVRDGFSTDFKNDFDAFSTTLTNAPPFYKDEGLKQLFLSDKFKVDWPTTPGPWEAGKYNARLIVEFDNNGWIWDADNNNIASVTLKLEPWGQPDPYHSIYNVGFDGVVGIQTDNGRQGYGTSYTQTTETPLYLNATLQARPDPRNNAVDNAIVSVDKSFYTMNTTNKGNVLTVQRTGDNTMIALSPSIAVPVVLDITRNTARDAYAYYMVEVDGKPQNDMGSSFMIWNGIGQGCYDFLGAGMGNWNNASDSKSDSADQGYGLRWNNATHAGTVSLYSTFYVPQESASVIRLTAQSESAQFESPFGNGQVIPISASDGIGSLNDVLEKVKSGDVCVVGGEYFWNSQTVYAPLQATITAKENTCIAQ